MLEHLQHLLLLLLNLLLHMLLHLEHMHLECVNVAQGTASSVSVRVLAATMGSRPVVSQLWVWWPGPFSGLHWHLRFLLVVH